MRKGALSLAVGVALLGWPWAPQLALASRAALVDAETVDVVAAPSKNAKILDKLNKGQQIAVSNLPIDGYYKVKTSNGVLGFVPADQLLLQAPPSEEAPVQAPPQGSDLSTPGSMPQGLPEQRVGSARPAALGEAPFRDKPLKKHLRLKGFGGYNFFSVTDGNGLFQADALKYGFNAGGEFAFMFTPDLAMVVRLEKMFKSVFARDTATLKTFQIDVSSIPFQMGIELTLIRDRRLSTHFSILGGLAVQTLLQSTALNEDAPNVTEHSAQAFTGMAKVDLTWHLGSTFSLFLEGGYRYLKTVQIVPGTSVNGSSLYKDALTQSFIPIAIDLSGPFVGGGIGVTF